MNERWGLVTVGNKRQKPFRRASTARLGIEPLEARQLLAIVPAGFTETPIATGLTSPVTLEIDNSGRVFVAFQDGTIRVIENDQLRATPFAVLNADGSGERGLQGIELDPDYETNGYIYVYYTAATPASHNRLSRLTINPTTGNTMLPGSEVVLLDLPNLSTVGNPIWHMGGAIHFAADGTILVQVGDHQDTSKPQDMQHPFGKVLRIRPDGTIPTDNPFYNAANGITWQDYIWSAGLRNPYSGDVNPVTGQFYVNDVGAGSWEEINDATSAGRNFGWPTTEGSFNPATFPNFTNPVHAYSHSQDCAITGGAFYNPSLLQFPAQYHGKYFFSQFCSGQIRVLNPAQPTQIEIFATNAEFPMNIEIAHDGSLYYIARGAGAGGNPGTGTGKVLKVVNDIQIPPQILVQPGGTLGSVGLSATFSVTAAGSPPLTYQWQKQESSGSTFANVPGGTSDTLTVAGLTLDDHLDRYRVLVSNAFGSVTSDAATLSVTTNQPPVVSIDSPAIMTRYAGGDQFTFSGSATDPETGALPASSMTWQIDFHHHTHLHPFYPATSGISSGTFAIPTTGETDSDVYYRIRLTVVDLAGLSTTVYRDIHPRLSTFTVTTNVSGGQVDVDGAPRTGPEYITGVVGIERSLAAKPAVAIGLVQQPFAQWLDGTTSLARGFSTQASHETYAALYLDAAQHLGFPSDFPVLNWPGTNGQGPFSRDKSNGGIGVNDGNPLRLNGVQYQRGLGVHAHSDLIFPLEGKYRRFISDLGIDDEIASGGSAIFQVFADGVLRYQSGVMTASSVTQSIDIDMTGVQEMRLVVTNAGDGNTNDHADWAGARLIRATSGSDLKINFQLAGAAVPVGYLPDVGQVFGDRGNGFQYGWSSNHTDVSRDRNANPDQRLDTVIQFHQGQTWEIALPNGIYQVTVAIGDAGFSTTQSLYAEGAAWWESEATAANDFRLQTQIVHVRDGRLTLDQGTAGEKATRINYLEITRSAQATTLLPYRDADLNLDGRLNLTDVNAFIAAWGTNTTSMSLTDRIRNGDFNFDGVTNLADWGILHQAWQRNPTQGQGFVAIVSHASEDAQPASRERRRLRSTDQALVQLFAEWEK